jgi:hypothetical protein
MVSGSPQALRLPPKVSRNDGSGAGPPLPRCCSSAGRLSATGGENACMLQSAAGRGVGRQSVRAPPRRMRRPRHREGVVSAQEGAVARCAPCDARARREHSIPQRIWTHAYYDGQTHYKMHGCKCKRTSSCGAGPGTTVRGCAADRKTRRCSRVQRGARRTPPRPLGSARTSRGFPRRRHAAPLPNERLHLHLDAVRCARCAPRANNQCA